MIATLAHELQHAVEVIEDERSPTRRAWSRSTGASAGEHGSPSPTRWETVAAQETGFQVRRELVAAPATTVARSERRTRS